MRVSTSQFYFQNSLQLSNKQSDVNDQIKYISSGKRVLTAKDDAVSYGTLTGYQNELASIEKYRRNITQAENRNSLVETSLANTEEVLQNLKTTFIQANNGTMSDADLDSLQQIFIDGQEQLLNLANSKDETGGYIFAGYQIDDAPFLLQPDSSVLYQGDSGVRELQIAKNVMVDTSQPGDAVFENVPNALGDFSATYNTNAGGVSLGKAEIRARGNFDLTPGAGYPLPLNVSFASATDIDITDADGDTIYSSNAYTPGQVISLPNGVDLQVNGNPLPGDNFDLDLEENISVFDTVKDAIDWLGQGQNPADPTQHQIEYSDILAQIDNALNHVISKRTAAGVNLQLIENQDSNHLDAELYLERGRANIEDLDFAKAVADFEQSRVALQAAQQTFVQVNNLSLFNYI